MPFTKAHFELLKRWQGQRYDNADQEQEQAYRELSSAYQVTVDWANEVQRRLFPTGRVKAVRKPINQAQNFLPYNWAKIYPSAHSPVELAYTVGIGADDGFMVKIDTVGLGDADPARKAYLALRSADDNTSPIVAKLSADEGLKMDMAQLVEWSAKSIDKFDLTYEQVCEQLDLKEQDAGLVHQEPMEFENNEHGVFIKPPPPKRKGHCMDVWVVSEALRRQLGLTPSLNEVRDDPSLARSNPGNVELEYYRWRKWRNEGGNRPVANTAQEPEDIVKASSQASQAQSGQPINRIYYGPPGTGKTYELSRLLKKDFEQATATMSADAWRSQFIAERIARSKWWEGAVMALYDLGEKATFNQLLEHSFIKAIARTKGADNAGPTISTTLRERTIYEAVNVNQARRFNPQVFDQNEERVWHLAGEWREACGGLVALVDEYRAGAPTSEVVRRYSFVTFHQSYGYEEFVEGLRPILTSDTEAGEIQYEIRPGVFKELCRKARLAPGERFAMVIDEINRGNISKIFGELITLIEADKREGASNAVSVTLPYSGETFSVPANVDIIGTMNTADRSLALLDTALRRRFDFVPVLPDARDEAGAPLFGLRVTAGEQVIDIPRLLSAINERIEALYDRDHCIGHAYFTTLAQVPDGDDRFVALAQVFSNRILPLLEEYFFEDWQKIRLVLADNQKPAAAQFVVEGQDQQDDLARLFGDDHGLDSYATRRRFAVQASAFANPGAYIGVYRTLTP